MHDPEYDLRLRATAMAWLDHQTDRGRDPITRDQLARQFIFEGAVMPLVDRGKGIRKPRALEAALSILTTYTAPGATAPYADSLSPAGVPLYKYRGGDPLQPDNVALRAAMELRVPIIWFCAIAPGQFIALYPMQVVMEEVARQQFVVAFDSVQRDVATGRADDAVTREWAQRTTKQRLHQPVFRARVIGAYQGQCAMCRLKYPSLLDAAHILPDGHPHGEPIVPNGLSLCKIHHAAYDQNFLGVRPDLLVEVRRDVRAASDGPMLLHGLKEMDGVRLCAPPSRLSRPDPVRLEERYEAFRSAG